MDVNGDERLHPLRAGFPVCDTVGGLNAAFAILAALYHREKTGEGQMIDVALLDSIMPLMGWVAANLLIGGQAPLPMGNDNFTAAPSGSFATQDGHVNIAANKQEQWEAMAEVIGAPELKTDPRFQERDERKKNRKALTPLVEEKLKQKPTADWVEALNARDVPSGDILSLKAALEQPQVQHRQVAPRGPGGRDRRGEALRPHRAALEDAGGHHLPAAAPRRPHGGGPGRPRLHEGRRGGPEEQGDRVNGRSQEGSGLELCERKGSGLELCSCQQGTIQDLTPAGSQGRPTNGTEEILTKIQDLETWQ